jgi:cob(I)alamin adenosyltransferase
MKIYTKTGDKGETGLVNGSRIDKSNLRITTYGQIDEINSQVGLCISFLGNKNEYLDIVDTLDSIQNQLFIVGADLANPNIESKDYRVSTTMTLFIEKSIDTYELDLDPIKYFILPGGSIESSLLHVCRTIVRRTETACVALAKSQVINNEILVYLNRLSDLLFVLARLANKRQNIQDIAWKHTN